jgi:hypothetical protein
MKHFSAPSHPLIHAFLLRREEFQGVEKLIVETQEQGEKLLKVFTELSQIFKLQSSNYKGGNSSKEYRLITTPTYILEVSYDTNLVGIFPIETLDWELPDEKELTLLITKGMHYSEELLVTWLTDHGFIAKKSDEENSFFRQGDTVSIQTKKGDLLVNFFGNTLESIYLDSVEQQEWRFFAC